MYLRKPLFVHDNLLSFLYKLGNLPGNEGFPWWFYMVYSRASTYSMNSQGTLRSAKGRTYQRPYWFLVVHEAPKSSQPTQQ